MQTVSESEPSPFNGHAPLIGRPKTSFKLHASSEFVLRGKQESIALYGLDSSQVISSIGFGRGIGLSVDY